MGQEVPGATEAARKVWPRGRVRAWSLLPFGRIGEAFPETISSPWKGKPSGSGRWGWDREGQGEVSGEQRTALDAFAGGWPKTHSCYLKAGEQRAPMGTA